VKIQNVSPLGSLDIDVLGLTVPGGATVEVPDAVAGRPPEARVAACEAELVAATARLDHHAAKALREEWTTLDHGVGLLAQPSNWRPAATPKTVKAVTTDEEAGK
jgi:hypothetical protein